MLAAAIFAIVTVQILSKTVAASITYCPFNEGNNELVIQNFPLKLLLQFLRTLTIVLPYFAVSVRQI